MLSRQPDDLGEWLADGTAFEAAGADALCIDLAPEPEFDPLSLTAALAAVTFRSLLVTSLPASGGPAIARTLGTIERLSHGRLRILADAVPSGELAGIALRLGIFRRVPGDSEAFEHLHEPEEAQRWIISRRANEVSWPPACSGKQISRSLLADHTERLESLRLVFTVTSSRHWSGL